MEGYEVKVTVILTPEMRF